MGGIVDGAKNVVNKVKSFKDNIIKAVKFVLTPVGQVIGIIILAVFLIFIIYVIIETAKNQLNIWFEGDDFAGISTTGDYDTIVGSLGYTGYDSFISEELWQEYAAFEYAVLMDVAEHMYEYQDYVTEIQDERVGKYTTSAVIPEGIVKKQYDAESITKSEWQEIVVTAQGGGAPETVGKTGDDIYAVGGNRNVTTPRLIYEMTNHDYEEDAMSLMPYLVVVREDIELNYFLKGLDKEIWKKYENLSPINNGDIIVDKLEPVRFSAELNRYNYNMPTSGYKKDLEDDHSGDNVIAVEDPEGFVDADRDNVGYGDDVYYIEQETDIVYKIPLRILINRYLPKSTLLTTWYMLKKDDGNENGFKIEELMDTIKGIYNAACYTSDSLEIPQIKTTGKKDKETGAINKGEGAGIILRDGVTDELDGNATVSSVKFDDEGSIVRDENGIAQKENKNIKFSKSNKRTFIYFEQYGLETSRYDLYVAYRGPSGDNEPYEADEARPEAISPSATYLTRDKVNFIKYLNFTLGEIKYIDNDGKEQTEEDLDVRLKPTYILDSGLDGENKKDAELIDEKLKSLYLFKNDLTARIKQKPPYSFMKELTKRVEEEVGNKIINKPSGDEKIFEHLLMNKSYMLAEIGNTDKIDVEKQLYYDTEEMKFRLPEDFRYYNQDDKMPHWYDFKTYRGKQIEIENAYLEKFIEMYKDPAYEHEMKEMLASELGLNSPKQIVSFEKIAKYQDNTVPATLYNGNKHVKGDAAIAVKDSDKYRVNYYWEGVYVIEEKELQMRQNIHHRRMPAVLVKYCDSWSKAVEYDNEVIQNSLNYRSYKYLIPESKTSLGLMKMNLKENPHYRVDSYKDFFNDKSSKDKGRIKEADVLDMLIQWEDAGNKGNEAAYAFMRDLYKLTMFIKEKQMLEGAYTYLYIPSTISNFDDATTQKIFWLERLGVSQGEDELNEEEEKVTRTKGNEIYWQNLEYDEYSECIKDSGDKEAAKVYALFPFGAPVIRTYYMFNKIDNLTQNGFGGGHDATDIYSRAYAKEILSAKDSKTEEKSVAQHIYFYELNRLTQYYMNNGNAKNDAFLLAEKELNNSLENYSLYSPVVAIAPGYVSEVDYDARSGFYVKIIHDYDINAVNESGEYTGPQQITSFYAHFKRWPLVEVGDYVGAGTVLGYEGTTGRSTGYHLHLSIKVNGTADNPHEYITPVFSPFYYDKKSEAVLEKDESKALGSEYYKLERTVLMDDGLFSRYNVINGMKLKSGKVVNYTPDSSPIYHSGDSYNGGAYSDLIWANNVPQKPLAEDVSDIMDLNLLNRTIPYEKEEGDDGSGGTLNNKNDVISNPDYFEESSAFVEERLEWPKWFAVAMAEYKSSLVVPYYNGPRSQSDEITEEGLEDLKAIQLSLKKAGYYHRANVNFEEAIFGTYSDKFVDVVKAMQQHLIDKGYGKYGVSVNGNLDVNTLNAYNTMVQYTKDDNQFAMAEKTSYNSSVDLSIEPALIWSILLQEGGYGDRYLALKESNDTVTSKNLEYKYYSTKDSEYVIYKKEFNREQGLMQISPEKAIERYEEDKVKDEDAVLFIKAPMRNTNIGMEMFKEYAVELYKLYSGDINTAKNKVVFHNNGAEYWLKAFEDSKQFDTRWIDGENIDRIMLYALALEAYNNEDIESVDVDSILNDGPTGYSEIVLENYFKLKYILQLPGKHAN